MPNSMHFADSLKVADAAKRSELMGKMEAILQDSGIMIQPTGENSTEQLLLVLMVSAGCILLMKCTLKKSGFHKQ